VNRIDARFKWLAERGQSAFIPYITAGDPTLDMTAKVVLELEKAGADVIELGIPFSDPIADGVVNQEAAFRALKNHVSLHDVVRMVGELRKSTEIPLLLFTYYNPVLAYGVEAFAKDCEAAGVDGVLCVDLPPEEDSEYKRCLDAAGIATIFLIAPTSTPDRVELLAKSSTGFIYYVSRTGVTGVRSSMETSVKGMVDAIKRHTKTPVAVGFGISKPEHAVEVAGYADGVIVGSAIVRMIGELGDAPDMPQKVGAFVKSLADATKSGKAIANA
jgi:tryptophan synthase alpha chain